MSSLPLQPAVELATRQDTARLDMRIDDLAVETRSSFDEIHRARLMGSPEEDAASSSSSST